MPFSPAAQANALYAATSPAATACLSSCQNAPGSMYAASVVSPGAVGPVAEARPGNYGGLNPMSLGPYYDPRVLTLRAPVDTVEGGVITAPSLAHGPSAFVGADVLPPRPKTQYAPHGVLQVDKLTLDVWQGPCDCACACFNVYSVAALVVCAANARVVRDMLVLAGVVELTPALAALTPACGACACRILGGPDFFRGLVVTAMEYVDTPIVSLLDVGATLARGVDSARLAYLLSAATTRHPEPASTTSSPRPAPSSSASGTSASAADTGKSWRYARGPSARA